MCWSVFGHETEPGIWIIIPSGNVFVCEQVNGTVNSKLFGLWISSKILSKYYKFFKISVDHGKEDGKALVGGCFGKIPPKHAAYNCDIWSRWFDLLSGKKKKKEEKKNYKINAKLVNPKFPKHALVFLLYTTALFKQKKLLEHVQLCKLLQCI